MVGLDTGLWVVEYSGSMATRLVRHPAKFLPSSPWPHPAPPLAHILHFFVFVISQVLSLCIGDHVSIIEGIEGNYAIFLFILDHVTEDSCGSTVDHEFRPGKNYWLLIGLPGQSPPSFHVRLVIIGCQVLPRPTVSRFACKEFSLPLIIRACILPEVFRTVVSSQGSRKVV